MKQPIKTVIAIISAMTLLATPVFAAVTSLAVNQKTHPGSSIRVPLELTADQQVAGINGTFTYDTNVFTNPRMDNGVAAAHFIIEGYERPDDLGNYRYVIYADPTASMSLTKGAVVYFMLDVKTGVPDSTISTILYGNSAASSPLGESLADVSFADAQIEVSTGTNNWALYE